MRFHLLYRPTNPCKLTHDIVTTNCKTFDCRNPLKVAAIHRRNHFEWNMQVGCYSFYFDMLVCIYSSELPTTFWYDLPRISTPAGYGAANTSGKCDWIWFKLNDKPFIYIPGSSHPAVIPRPVGSCWWCNWTHWHYNPTLKFQNSKSYWTEQE
jgi:hypothetical protein